MPESFDIKAFRKTVRDVARSVSKNFPAYVEANDVEQELYLWLYSKRAWIVSQMEDDATNVAYKITPLMRKVAFDHCNKEKAATEGYAEEDLYRYSIPTIKRLLVNIFDYQDWQSFESSTSRPHFAGNQVTELIDVKSALSRLTDAQYSVIVWKYKHSWTDEIIAEELNLTTDAAKKRHQRALTAIQRTLGYKDSGETRKALERRPVRSNAAALAAVSNSYEGA